MSRMRGVYQQVPALWARFVFSDRVTTRLVENLHGDSSGVRGAAWLWSRTSASGAADADAI
jgi:fructokinase